MAGRVAAIVREQRRQAGATRALDGRAGLAVLSRGTRRLAGHADAGDLRHALSWLAECPGFSRQRYTQERWSVHAGRYFSTGTIVHLGVPTPADRRLLRLRLRK